jgi:tryptophan synthase alpha chain
MSSRSLLRWEKSCEPSIIMSRLAAKFAALKKEGRAAFVPFITAGDPDMDTSFAILEKLPAAGADVIELGMPFTDPMADGPAVQASSVRALKAGATLLKVFELVKKFRKADKTTPIVLMGYYNPIHAYGTARFARDVAAAGVDGLIVVDLPVEEDEVLRVPALAQGVDLVRFVTPTTDEARLKRIVGDASGYLYYVSVAGVTGTKAVPEDEVRAAMTRVKAATDLPCAVGFGIRSPEQAAAVARVADGVVVGSAIVSLVAVNLDAGKDKIVAEVLELSRKLAGSTHAAHHDRVLA